MSGTANAGNDVYPPGVHLFLVTLFALFPLTVSALTFEGVSCDDPLTLDHFERIKCCFRESRQAGQCLDGVLGELVQAEGAKAVLHAAEEVRLKDAYIDRACHQIVHAIGRTAYRQLGFGKAFHACDATCQSGCLHGVLERVFLTPQELAAGEDHVEFQTIEKRIREICTAERIGSVRPDFLMQCHHGLGHAALYSLRYDIPRALNACDLLPKGMPRESCYLGVFMENTNAPDTDERDIRKDHPLYPCDIVDERYQGACYNNHTKAWILLGDDEKTIAERCKTLGIHAHECFVGLGRDASPLVRSKGPEHLGSVCEELAGSYAADCIQGAVYALVDFTTEPSGAYAFCTFLSPDNRTACFERTNRYLRSMYAYGDEGIAKACEALAPEARELCESHDAHLAPDPLWRILMWVWNRLT
jgi:hypothetical protein